MHAKSAGLLASEAKLASAPLIVSHGCLERARRHVRITGNRFLPPKQPSSQLPLPTCVQRVSPPAFSSELLNSKRSLDHSLNQFLSADPYIQREFLRPKPKGWPGSVSVHVEFLFMRCSSMKQHSAHSHATQQPKTFYIPL